MKTMKTFGWHIVKILAWVAFVLAVMLISTGIGMYSHPTEFNQTIEFIRWGVSSFCLYFWWEIISWPNKVKSNVAFNKGN